MNAFLSHLAVKEHVSASTQTQALSAILFMYRQLFKRELGVLDGLVRARKSKHLPTVLTKGEVRSLLRGLTGDIDCLIREIRSRSDSADRKMSEDELAELTSAVKNGKKVLDDESAERVLSYLASAGDQATVELRAGHDADTLHVVVSGSQGVIAELENGTAGS